MKLRDITAVHTADLTDELIATASVAPPEAQTLEFIELDHQPAPDAPHAIKPSAAGRTMADDNPLRHIRTRLTVCVGSIEMTVGELLGAREQQVVRLDQAVDQPVDILLGGQVVARGALVAVDEHFGVRITELPKPLTP